MQNNNANVQFIIIGSGIAGMSTALHLSKLGNVTLYTKSKLISGSTPLAQGGIAGVIDAKDSFENHIQDTMKAGGYANNTQAVELLVHRAPEEIKFLHKIGVQFEKDQHLEGGHSFPRVSNIKDISGKIIAEVLAQNVHANTNITIQEHATVYEIDPNDMSIVYEQNQKKYKHFSDFIIVATGGYSSLFQNSTSPQENMGDGISLCINAGIKTKDLDKVQFHPTVLQKKRKNKPQLLLTEAIRGFGAKIINKEGNEIIDALQPRDIVSKAIYNEELRNITNNKKNPVFLDARNIINFSTQFPFLANVLATEFSLNPEKELLPISFGAHYCMGGIETNIWGETSSKNIYAVGECANTGVHGNNRLASNSLLEGLVFARQIAIDIQTKIENLKKKRKKIKYQKKLEQLEQLEERKEREEIEKLEENNIYNQEFLKTIKKTLSQYLSIEENKEQKKENIKTAQKIFNTIETHKIFLSETNKNILVLVQELVKDAQTHV